MGFILGIVFLLIGILLVWKSEWLLENFGRIGFFEEHLHGEGGSRLGYKLLGIFFAFLGILAMTGMIGDFLNWVFWPIIKHSRQLGEM